MSAEIVSSVVARWIEQGQSAGGQVGASLATELERLRRDYYGLETKPGTETWRRHLTEYAASGAGMDLPDPQDCGAALVRIVDLEAEVAAYAATRTLGGPITGKRVPDRTDTWANDDSAGPVQHDYTGHTDEGNRT